MPPDIVFSCTKPCVITDINGTKMPVHILEFVLARHHSEHTYQLTLKTCIPCRAVSFRCVRTSFGPGLSEWRPWLKEETSSLTQCLFLTSHRAGSPERILATALTRATSKHSFHRSTPIPGTHQENSTRARRLMVHQPQPRARCITYTAQPVMHRALTRPAERFRKRESTNNSSSPRFLLEYAVWSKRVRSK